METNDLLCPQHSFLRNQQKKTDPLPQNAINFIYFFYIPYIRNFSRGTMSWRSGIVCKRRGCTELKETNLKFKKLFVFSFLPL